MNNLIFAIILPNDPQVFALCYLNNDAELDFYFALYNYSATE